MAGVTAKGNKFIALFYVNGKKVKLSTGIDVEPKVIPHGKSKKSLIEDNERRARLIANELEKRGNGIPFDENLLASLGGKKAGEWLKGTGGQPVCDYLKDYLKTREQNPKAYKRDWKPIIDFITFLGNRSKDPIGSVTRNDALEYMESQLDRVSAGTVGRYVQSLSTAFNKAIDKEIITSNPFKGVMPSKQTKAEDKNEKESFTVSQVKKMFSSFPGEWPDIIRVCLFTGGQRFGDIVTLRWSAVFLEEGFIRMNIAKKRESKSKPIIKQLRDVLERRMKTRCSDYIFPKAAMSFFNAGESVCSLSNEFRSLLKIHGILPDSPIVEKKGERRQVSPLTFHSLRSTAVTVLREAGVSADMCRMLVGHDSEAIERVYFRPDEKSQHEALGKLGAALE